MSASNSQIRRPSTFLSLAPTQSDSYPVRKASVASAPKSPEVAATKVEEAPPATEAPVVESGIAHRRSSSTSTTSDKPEAAGLRYLKLNPVHWGEGDGKGDWSAAIAE